MTDTTTLAPTNAEILDLWADVVAKRRSSDDIPVVVLVRDALAKWGAPATASAFDKDGIREAGLAYARSEGHGYPVDSADAYLAGWLSLYMTAPPAQEAQVPLDPKVVGDLWLKSQGVCLTFCRLLEAEHGITAAQKEAP